MARMSDQQAAQVYRDQLKRRAGDSAKHRTKNKAKRRPARGDVASAALRLLLTSAVRHPERAAVWIAAISRDLAALKKPFDPVETAVVLEAMIGRHREAMKQAAHEREAESTRDARE